MDNINKTTEVVVTTASVAEEQAVAIAPKADIVDKTHIRHAYVLEYRNAEQRCARLASMGKAVAEDEKDLREVCIVLEGKPVWAKTKMGNIFPGTRIWATYLKDKDRKIVKRSVKLSREEPKA